MPGAAALATIQLEALAAGQSTLYISGAAKSDDGHVLPVTFVASAVAVK
jgi:hypothetical protein